MINLFELKDYIPKAERFEKIRNHSGTAFFSSDFECLTCGKNLDINSYSGEFCCTNCAEIYGFKKRFGGIRWILD